MKIIFTTLFLVIINSAFGQREVDCILIDFETLPASVPVEGLSINEEYRDSFGLYFELENGGVPVIAEVGNPRTAFGSDFGADTPAPGQGIGRFFLTDDGLLSGLNSPPIIVRFDNPIDTFSGCILDMDFDELFIVHARDNDDNIILADTIRAGDPGTGDGISTCWGFNLPKCSGSVYSVRFEGRRQQAGAFGMGLDNLSFCTGVDFDPQISFTTTATTCDSLFSGVINVINEGQENFEYSIDNGPFQEDTFFEDLTGGNHLISLLDISGCIESYVVNIKGPQPIEFLNIDAGHTTCEEDNGSISILVSSQEGVSYSLNNIEFQSQTTFSSLPSGKYTVYAQDSFGCIFFTETAINPSQLPEIQTLMITEDYCGESRGTIEINASGGTGILTYAINEQTFQADQIFTNLNAGQYTISVIDEDECLVSDTTFIPATSKVEISGIEVVQPVCGERFGIISVSWSGGSGMLDIIVDNGVPQSDSLLIQVGLGIHQLHLIDQYGCRDSISVKVESPRCPVYVPNVIAVNGKGNNQYFKLGTSTDYLLGIKCYQIYDRWGELVYKSSGFSIHEEGHWWDGKFKGRMAEPGVYAYLIEVEHENGDCETLSGDVTLLR
jgi:hypothetical protein